MEKSSFIKKADIILIVVILIAAALFILTQYLDNSPPIAVIYSGGEEIERIDLTSVTEPYRITLDCTPVVEITVEPGIIYYSYAECHDKLCINCGQLISPGNTAACLPSETLIVIEGQTESDEPDVITY